MSSRRSFLKALGIAAATPLVSKLIPEEKIIDINPDEQDYKTIRTDGVARMRITKDGTFKIQSSGRIGIGTTNPSSSLK